MVFKAISIRCPGLVVHDKGDAKMRPASNLKSFNSTQTAQLSSNDVRKFFMETSSFKVFDVVDLCHWRRSYLESIFIKL